MELLQIATNKRLKKQAQNSAHMLLRKNGHVVLKYRIRHRIERKGMAYMNGKGFHRLFFADPAHIFLGTPGAFGDFRNNFPVVVGDLQLF